MKFIAYFLALFIVVSCGPHLDSTQAPTDTGSLIGVNCEVVAVPNSTITYDGMMCKNANEVPHGVVSIDPVRISCYRQMAINCNKPPTP